MNILVVTAQRDRANSVPTIEAAIAKAREVALDAVAIDDGLDVAAFRAACPYVPIVPISAVDNPLAAELAVTRAKLVDLEHVLTGMLGHDVRTPLHAITLGCDLLDARAPEARPAIDRVRRAASRASSIVDDVLDVAELSVGNALDMAFEPDVELTGLVDRIVAEQRAAQPKRAIAYMPPTAIEIRADSTRLARVICHAIAFVVQHAVTSSHIVVELTREASRVVVAVRCDGALGEPRTNGAIAIGLRVGDAVVRAHGGTLSITRDGVRIELAT